MSRFPVVLEHEEAIGVEGGKHVRASVLAATAAVLLARGADQIIIPVPGSYEQERAEEAVEGLPKERRGLVRFVDKDAMILHRVREYLAPLEKWVGVWPQGFFIGECQTFLYQMAIASKYKAGVLDNSVSRVREFIPLLDPYLFSGEARFRLAELVSLVCSYEPTIAEHGAYRTEVSGKGIARSAWDLLDTAEFHSLVTASGKLGYLKHPIVALKKLRRLVLGLISRPEAKPFLHLATTTAEMSGVGASKGLIDFVGELVADKGGASFRAPFMDLGPASLGVYRVALAEAFPNASPPSGSIYYIERRRAGHGVVFWLNVGEEDKLDREAKEGIRQRQLQLSKARELQGEFFKLGNRRREGTA